MRILVLFAHPVETSFGAAVHGHLIATLRSQGHQVDDCDLNAEGFNPVMSRQERLDYHDPSINCVFVRGYIERLLAAEALVLSYPVWNMGFPAILKGFLDRVFLPGVSFDLTADGGCKPNLHNIKRLAAVCTYGAGRVIAMYLGDPPRLVVKRVLRSVCAPGAPCDYLAHYGMNHSTPERRSAFLKQVEKRFSEW